MFLLISFELLLFVASLALIAIVVVALLGRRGKADYELRRGENARTGSSAITSPDRQQHKLKPPAAILSFDQERLSAEIAAQQRARIAWQNERSKVPDDVHRLDEQADGASTEVERTLARVRQANAPSFSRLATPQPEAGARLNNASSPHQTLADSVQGSYAKVAWAFVALARKLES